jgi:hypothetical protein
MHRGEEEMYILLVGKREGKKMFGGSRYRGKDK